MARLLDSLISKSNILKLDTVLSRYADKLESIKKTEQTLSRKLGNEKNASETLWAQWRELIAEAMQDENLHYDDWKTVVTSVLGKMSECPASTAKSYRSTALNAPFILTTKEAQDFAYLTDREPMDMAIVTYKDVREAMKGAELMLTDKDQITLQGLVKEISTTARKFARAGRPNAKKTIKALRSVLEALSMRVTMDNETQTATTLTDVATAERDQHHESEDVRHAA